MGLGGWDHPPCQLKRRIDRAFMEGFQRPTAMADVAPMACRVARLLPPNPAQPDRVGLGGQPEDAARLDDHSGYCKAWMAFLP